MDDRNSWGYAIAVVAVTAAVAATLYFMGEGSQAAITRAEIAGLVGLTVLMLRGPVAASWSTAARYARDRTRHRRDPAARVGKAPTPDTDLAALRYASLQFALKDRRIRRLPRLLVVGDDEDIVRRLAPLVEAGWYEAPEALLLWCNACLNPPDMAWMARLYKLRRRRPVDAIVLVVDGEAALPTQGRHKIPTRASLGRIGELLRWSAPVFVFDVSVAKVAVRGDSRWAGCELPRQADAGTIEQALLAVRDQLAARGIEQMCRDLGDSASGELSKHLDDRAQALANWIGGWHARRSSSVPVAGIVLASLPKNGAASADAERNVDLPVWQYLADASRRHAGHRIGAHPVTVLSIAALGVAGLWMAGMLVSGITNGRDLRVANQVVREIRSAHDPAAGVRGLLALQQQIARYEYRVQHGAPLLTRFGLNRDSSILAALWQPYEHASHRLLVAPVQHALEASLTDLTQMRADALDDPASGLAQAGEDALKAYLMLAEPVRAESAFLAPQMARHWATDSRMPAGERQDLGERLFKFFADHLQSHPDWKIEPQLALVASARQTLLAVVGQRNAQHAVYQGLVDGFASSGGNGKYPDKNLASLTAGTDARGLLRSAAMVPGMFTREAYEGYVASAIEAAAKRSVIANDWVLTDGKPATSDVQGLDGEDLKAALTAQYFADYAEHWQGFMNSLQWEAASTLPAAIDQLKLMADVRQSPVIALMKALEYQGGAGARQDSLTDTLVAKAQNMLGKQPAHQPMTGRGIRPDFAGPLSAAFGPVLRLVGQSPANQANVGSVNGELSLQRFLDRATALRLRLQQVSHSAEADAQARQMAQAMFQGKASELADTQAYGELIAASLGNQWAGMGEALFVRPIAQATQRVLLPAQASLNDAWRHGVALTWDRAFAGRYPFVDSADDASLPELARFLQPRNGLIEAFLTTQLAGVLELQGDQWVPVATGRQALAFDPAFLKAINTLQRLAAHLLPQGQPQYRFEFKPIPTAGLTETLLTIDGQKLRYYNQRESWTALTWPARDLQEVGTRLQWQTERAGTSKNYELGGRWGLIRMLERAHIEPVSHTTFQLTWRAAPDTTPNSAQGMAEGLMAEALIAEDLHSLTSRKPRLSATKDLTDPIRYQMRTEIGQGPLEMLWLRNFVLPTRIFAGPEVRATAYSRPPAYEPG